MQPDIGPSPGRGGHQRGQTQKGKATKQPELPKGKKAKFQQHPNAPQEPLFIPFDHRKGQNELRQRMVQYIQKLPQESHQRMANYMHYLLTLLPKPQTHQPIQTTSEGDQSAHAGRN